MLIVFFGISLLFIYIFAFSNKMDVKVNWEIAPIALAMWIILFICWIYSFNLVKVIYNKIRVYINKYIKKEKLIKEQPISVSLESKKKNIISNGKLYM